MGLIFPDGTSTPGGVGAGGGASAEADPDIRAIDATTPFFGLSKSSGLLAAIVAGTATLGHLCSIRYAPGDDRRFYVTHLRVYWQTLVGFTAAQEIAFGAYKLAEYTEDHDGGTVESVPGLSPEAGVSDLIVRMADVSVLIAGTHAVEQRLLRGSYAELATGDSISRGYVDEQLPMMDDPHPVIVLAGEQGILIRNEVLMGAGGSGRLTVDIRGYERVAS